MASSRSRSRSRGTMYRPKTLVRSVIFGVFALLAFALLLSPVEGWANHGTPITTCGSSLVGRTTLVANTDGHTTPHDSQGAGGAPAGFDPTPLLSQWVYVNGASPSCLIAHFSVHTLRGSVDGNTYDDFATFQVTVDGQPMIGHTTWCSDGVINFACVVAEYNTITMHSYTFFATVKPGWHKVEVRYAGCCSGLGAYVGGAVLALEHR